MTEQWTLPFGNMQPFTSIPGGENPYQHPTLGNPSKKRFTSYDRSDATGLDYAVNRFYSPQHGRFTQVDPIGMGSAELANPQSLNLYAYIENDPINSTDPLGLDGSISYVSVIRYSTLPSPTRRGGGGWGGLSLGPISFSFSFGGGSFLNFGSLQQSKGKKRQAGVSSSTIKGGNTLSGTTHGGDGEIGKGDFGFYTDGLSSDEMLDAVQLMYDVLGLFPGGEQYDYQSAQISYARGDNVGGHLSMAAMAPFGGQLATFAKFLRGLRGGRKALPAARKIQAAWGVSRYQHGGLMQGIEHIMYRHGPNSGFKNVSRF